jgi:hypothetical protein
MFLSKQSFGYGPAAKCSPGNARAGVIGCLFEAADQAIAPMRQAGAYIRSCEICGIVDAHGDLARKPKRWLEYELDDAAETREASPPPEGSLAGSLCSILVRAHFKSMAEYYRGLSVAAGSPSH